MSMHVSPARTHETLYNPFIVEVLNEEINYRN